MLIAISPKRDRAMAEPTTHLVTQLLHAVGEKTPGAEDRLWELVYQELRQLAAAQVRLEGAANAIQPTTLVHEAYVRLMAGGNGHFENRRHFFAAAGKAMRRIRVDGARTRNRLKRGGPGVWTKAPEDRPAADEAETPQRYHRASAEVLEHIAAEDEDPTDVLAMNEALEQLADASPELAELVDLLFFAEMTIDEAAEVMGVAPRTLDSRWRLAKAWLHRQLSGAEASS